MKTDFNKNINDLISILGSKKKKIRDNSKNNEKFSFLKLPIVNDSLLLALGVSNLHMSHKKPINLGRFLV